MAEVPGSGTQLPEGLALWLVVGLLRKRGFNKSFIVSSERCLCGALGIGLEAHNQSNYTVPTYMLG